MNFEAKMFHVLRSKIATSIKTFFTATVQRNFLLLEYSTILVKSNNLHCLYYYSSEAICLAAIPFYKWNYLHGLKRGPFGSARSLGGQLKLIIVALRLG